MNIKDLKDDGIYTMYHIRIRKNVTFRYVGDIGGEVMAIFSLNNNILKDLMLFNSSCRDATQEEINLFLLREKGIRIDDSEIVRYEDLKEDHAYRMYSSTGKIAVMYFLETDDLGSKRVSIVSEYKDIRPAKNTGMIKRFDVVIVHANKRDVFWLTESLAANIVIDRNSINKIIITEEEMEEPLKTSSDLMKAYFSQYKRMNRHVGTHGDVGLPGPYSDKKPDPLIAYINILWKDERSEKEMLMNYITELSFLGFSKVDGGTVFKVNDDMDNDRWGEIFEGIRNKKGTFSVIMNERIKDHI